LTGTLRQELESVSWYHSIELPGGLVTPGHFDTLAEREFVPLPASLDGKRCIDIGTADGFWAFEMERRGAAEVVAVDVDRVDRYDWPGVPDAAERHRFERDHPNHRAAFEIAHRALGSSVERRDMRVYDLHPDGVGRFDFAFMGSLLLHLRDPVGAAAAVLGVLRDEGELLSVDSISPLLTLLHPRQAIARLEAPGWPLWWVMNLAAYRRVFPAAGYEVLDKGRPFRLPPGPAYHAKPRARRPLYGLVQPLVARSQGVPHAWVRAGRPAARV
jgi:tRNA (mo5U34)-methyltransferase